VVRGGALAGALLAVLLAACGAGGGAEPADPAPPVVPPAGWLTVASAPAGALTVELRSDRALGTGLTALAVRVTGAGGAAVDPAAVELELSLAGAGGAVRRAPLLAPPALDPDGTWRAFATLAAPSGGGATWSARVTVSRSGAAPETALLTGLAVAERHLAAAFASGPVEYLFGLRFDGSLRVGANPAAVALHVSTDGGLTHAPVTDATFAVEPWMPSMGHGSPGSVPPVPAGAPGRYEGKVSLSMYGDWEVVFTVSRGGAEVGRPAITLFF
jgi:hypothetical protein